MYVCLFLFVACALLDPMHVHVYLNFFQGSKLTGALCHSSCWLIMVFVRGHGDVLWQRVFMGVPRLTQNNLPQLGLTLWFNESSSNYKHFLSNNSSYTLSIFNAYITIYPWHGPDSSLLNMLCFFLVQMSLLLLLYLLSLLFLCCFAWSFFLSQSRTDCWWLK